MGTVLQQAEANVTFRQLVVPFSMCHCDGMIPWVEGCHLIGQTLLLQYTCGYCSRTLDEYFEGGNVAAAPRKGLHAAAKLARTFYQSKRQSCC